MTESTPSQHAPDDLSAYLNGVSQIGRYQITDKLGQGSTGIVFLGYDPYIKREVAIKLSQPESEKAKTRFFVEAQAAGRLNHPHIVAIHDAGTFDPYCYITMEYVKGDTLERFCQPEHLLPVRKSVEIIFNVCNALEYAHQKGVIHRDIKPSNIMIDPEGIAKLSDFGIAVQTEETSEMGVWGTPRYMAPEQLREDFLGPQTDIFSLGCVMHELLTGEFAFKGDNNFSIMYKITNEDPAPIRAIRPDLPDILEEIVKRTLQKEPEDRYPSCFELAYDLRLALQGLTDEPGHKRAENTIDFIHHLPFFQDFTKDQIRKLCTAASIIKVVKGRVIVTEGEIDDTFYIILSGKVRIQKAGTEMAVIGVGECFGEMAYLAGRMRSATATAATAGILMKISSTLLEGAPESIQLKFFKSFAKLLVSRLAKSAG